LRLSKVGLGKFIKKNCLNSCIRVWHFAIWIVHFEYTSRSQQ
jgi:hypothetical protein